VLETKWLFGLSSLVIEALFLEGFLSYRHGVKMWPICDKTVVSERFRFLSGPNYIFTVTCKTISVLERFYHIATETAF